MIINQLVDNNTWVTIIDFEGETISNSYLPVYITGSFNNWIGIDETYKVPVHPKAGMTNLKSVKILLPKDVDSFEFKLFTDNPDKKNEKWIDVNHQIYRGNHESISNEQGSQNVIVRRQCECLNDS